MFGMLLLLLMFNIVIFIFIVIIHLFIRDGLLIVWSTFCWTLSANNGQLQAKFLVGVTKVYKWKIARL